MRCIPRPVTSTTEAFFFVGASLRMEGLELLIKQVF